MVTNMPDDIWNERREQHEAAVIRAAVELLEFMGDVGAFRIDLGTLITIVAGPRKDLPKLLDDRRMTPKSSETTGG